MWSSVLNDDPDRSDQRTYHEAREVIKGTKYAANAWSELIVSSTLILRVFFFALREVFVFVFGRVDS